jgi:dipicolinate synthase subunit B
VIGYAFCGSFCTLSESLASLSTLIGMGIEIQPIMSERVYKTDTRFYKAKDFQNEVELLTKRRIIHSVEDAEPLGTSSPLDALIVAPCTGNSLAKLSAGITDSAVTMAMKAHLRCDRPTLICLATNDAMSQNLKNIAFALSRKSVYLLPMKQDNPMAKPYSLVSDFTLIPKAYEAMLKGEQLRPLFL